jgi:hypothetical protein
MFSVGDYDVSSTLMLPVVLYLTLWASLVVFLIIECYTVQYRTYRALFLGKTLCCFPVSESEKVEKF